MKNSCLLGVLAVTLVALPGAARAQEARAEEARAQDLVKEALNGFPIQTIRLEFSSPAKLRRLPNYASLHQRYVGPRLRKLVELLGQLGVREEDISGLVLGWQPGTSEMGLYGYATGRFSAKEITQRAEQQSITPTPIAGMPAYCLEAGVGATCVVVFENSVGAFGTIPELTAMLETRQGQIPSLSSDNRFPALVESVNKDAPIWGVAVGAAVGDWFKGWMPNQGNVKMDWNQVFGNVDSLTYTVATGNDVTLSLKMQCASADSAASLRQVLEGLKLIQQLAWDSQNPGKPNPYKNMDVGQDNNQVSLKLTTGYSELELASGALGN